MLTRQHVNDLAYEIVGCAIEVHKEIGPGVLESIYELCMIEELRRQSLKVVGQVPIKVHYKGKPLDAEYRIDLLVEDLIIVELKAVEEFIPVHRAQLLTYLKLLQKPKGLLINFNCANIVKEGLVPLVTPSFAELPEKVWMNH